MSSNYIAHADPVVIKVDVDNGLAVPEGRIVATLQDLIAKINAGQPVPALGTNELVSGLRFARRRELIGDISFDFGGWVIPVTPCGQMQTWPVGFPGDVMDSILSGLLTKDMGPAL
jgi:hypothetical protein